jgi:Ca-activated chloride channel homolog
MKSVNQKQSVFTVLTLALKKMSIMKAVFTTTVLMFAALFIYAQNKGGQLDLTIQDKVNGQPLPYITAILSQNNSQIDASTSDMNGKVLFKNLKKGKYDVKIISSSYNQRMINSISIDSNKTKKLKIEMEANMKVLEAVQIVDYKTPLIDPATKSGGTVTREAYQNLATKNINSVASSTPGIAMQKEKKRRPTSGQIISNAEIASNNLMYHQISTPNKDDESYAEIKENEFILSKKEPLSTFSIDVDKASYSNVRRFINAGQMPPKEAVRTEELINYFPYQYKENNTQHPVSIQTELTEAPWQAQHYIAKIAMNAKKLDASKAPDNNLVFLIDVSGSMSDANKLPLVQSSLNMMLDELRLNDKIAIVVYAGAAGLVLPPTTIKDKQKIKDALNNLSAGGSTAGGAGIELAYKTAKDNFIKEGNNRVILCTDGDFNVGISADKSLESLIEEKRKDGVYLTVLGYGMGNYKDSKMEILADKGNGNYAYIDNIQEAKKTLVNEMLGTLYTVAKDVKIQIEFNPALVQAYRLIGYENRLLAKEDFNNDLKDAGEVGAGHQVTAIYEIIPVGVNTNYVGSVDQLKYTKEEKTETNVYSTNSNELLNVKCRYKLPESNTSVKFEAPILVSSKTNLKNASEDTKFATALAAWSMLLRNSNYKGNLNYKSVIEMAKSAKTFDPEGYRAECIRLMESSQYLKANTSVVVYGEE